MDYRRHDGTPSRCELEPHRIVHAGHRWYVVAWDVERGDWRTFRLDRLSPRTPTGPRFDPRPAPEPDIAAYTSRGITTEAYRYRCRVRVSAPAAVVAVDQIRQQCCFAVRDAEAKLIVLQQSTTRTPA